MTRARSEPEIESLVVARTYLKLVVTILASGALLAGAIAASAIPVGLVANAGEGEPSTLELDALEQRSYVYSQDETLLAGLHGEINREPVTLEQVSEAVVPAILSVEDNGFWVHNGVDARGILRALRVNVDEGGVSQGGSTITQQVVKLSLLGDEQSLERKVQEFVLAQRLEREMSKEEILTRYINIAYFGNGAYGVQAAAETYFGISASELNIGQAALLAGMINSPRYNDPVRYPQRAKERRSTALELMEEEGYITADERTFFDATPMPTEVQRVVPEPNNYFVEEVKSQLLDENDERFAALGTTYEERERAVFTGGLRVYTTYDPQAQQQAIEARNSVLPGENAVFNAGVNNRTGEPFNGTGALVSIQPSNGAVRAMVGGPGFGRYQYNLTTIDGRQIGSTHKAFTLTSIIDQGHSPEDTVDGRGPCTFSNPEGTPDPYVAENFGNDPGEIDTIVNQTTRSSNCSFIRLASIAGYQNVADTATALGVPEGTIDAENLASALGTSEVRPIDMASAYATLANDGMYNEPYYIERVEGPDGRVLYQHETSPQRAVSSETARLVTSVLEQNVIRGTGTRAGVPGHQIAGKTGTTQDQSDVWFVGYAPQLATAVWVGGMGTNAPFTVEGETPSSSRHAAQMFGNFMAAYLSDRDPVPFQVAPSRPGGEYLQTDDDFDRGSPQPEPEPETTTTTTRPDRPPTTRPGRPTTTEPPAPTTLPTLPDITLPPFPSTTEPPTTSTTEPGGGGGPGGPGGGGGGGGDGDGNDADSG